MFRVMKGQRGVAGEPGHASRESNSRRRALTLAPGAATLMNGARATARQAPLWCQLPHAE